MTMPMTRFGAPLAAACLALVALAALPQQQALGATSFYVDCTGGNDSAAGTTPTTAWRSVARANKANLTAGGQLLFKRGCTWSGTPLMVRWSGTSSAPITLGAYGTGNKPMFQNSDNQLYITGSWLIIDGLAARADPVTYDTQCQNAPAGRRSGFRLRPGANNNVLRNLTANDLFIGIWVEQGSTHNKILTSTLANNRMKSDIFTSDAGAVAIALHGDDNEVAFNTISGSDTCSRFYGRDGSAVEINGGQRNNVHHNRSIDNNIFTELSLSRAMDNTFAYNVVTSSLPSGHFLTTRGAKDATYGPVYRTKAYNNTVYLTGASSYAIQCGSGCGTSILSLRDNIIGSTYAIGYADAAFDEAHNIYWAPNGSLKLWFPISSSSRKANPLWAAPTTANFHLQALSPAVNAGAPDAKNLGYTTDYAKVAVPQGSAVDIGAYEYVP
jgi:hypothetical protein